MDDNELQRVLARASGWTLRPVAAGRWDFYYEGELFSCPSEHEALEKLASLNRWRESVDAALALPWPEYKNIVMEIGPAGAYAAFATDGHSYEVLSSSLARALCEVFAQWAVAQEAKEGER